MNEQLLPAAGAAQGFQAGRLPLFDEIAQGFLKALANHQANGEASSCLHYLDGKVKIDCTTYPRRVLVLAIEDMKQPIEAPQQLRSAACAFMKIFELNPVPELKLYRDVATAILRIDAAMHLSRINGSRMLSIRNPVYH
jgi:hypothetical protein